MENYINVDKNMIVTDTIGEREVTWYDVKQAPFSLHGFYEPLTEPFFRRLPADVAAATSEGVDKLSRESVGGRVRFATNSPFIAIRAHFLAVGRSSHLTLISSSGFDLYIDGEFGSRLVREFRMPYDMTDSYQGLLEIKGGAMRSYTVNFPVHAVVDKLEIGLMPGAQLEAPRPYRDVEPVIFYGSSIVHGTGAVRPGGTYPAVVSREWNIDYRNLGFSGKALGEKAIMQWMRELPMSVFVCDYDHNAPNPEHLQQTHFPFYELFREKRPDTPYIMISRPNYWTCPNIQEEILQRRDIVMASYLKARALGDKNVYFIDGMSFFTGPHSYECLLDGVHPNDLGYVRMADSIGTLIRHILEMAAEKAAK